MASGARLSIILPTHNRRNTVHRAIRSVLNQTFSDFELIIVDDGSTDGTRELVSGLDDTRISIIRFKNRRGAAAARNAGVRRSSAPILAFQDSDDVWRPDKLERQMSFFQHGAPEMSVVYSDMVRIYQNGRREYHTSPDVSDGALIRGGRYSVYGIGIQSALIRKEALVEAGWFDESLRALIDLELFIRLSRRGLFCRIAEPLVLYARGGTQITADRRAVLSARAKLLRIYRRELLSFPSFYLKEFLAIQRGKLLLRAQADGESAPTEKRRSAL